MSARLIGLLTLAALLPPPALGAAHLMTETLNGGVPVQTWKARRDARVVKQDEDFSCGAASLATLLTHYYQRPTTEREILDLLAASNKDKAAASFEDMARVLPALGFRGAGLALSWEQLTKSRVPMLVFVRARKEDHFAVLSGIGGDRVRLSDPALGNRVLSRRQFLDIWNTRDDMSLTGRVLTVLPRETVMRSEAFFHPPNVSAVPYELMSIRRF